MEHTTCHDPTMSGKVIRLTDPETGVGCVSFWPDGAHIVGGDYSGVMHQWRVKDGVEISQWRIRSAGLVVYAVAMSPDGRWIVTSGPARNTVVVWNARTYENVVEVVDHTDHVYTVDVSSDSRRFASGSEDCTVRIFDITSGSTLLPPLQHQGRIIGVKFSPDGGRIAAASQYRSTVAIYNAHSGSKLFEFPFTSGWTPSTPLAWSSYGRKVYAASVGNITSFDTSTSSRSEWPIHDDASKHVSILTTGKFIAFSAGSTVSFWDTASQVMVGRIDHSAPITCIAVSQNGRQLACGLATGIAIHCLKDHLPQLGFPQPDLPKPDLPKPPLHPSGVSQLPLIQVSDKVLESWMSGNMVDTKAMLSDEIWRSSDPSHEAFATRALVWSHLGEWRTALQDADTYTKSLQIRRSPIGRISRCIALINGGEPETALDEFDFVLLDIDSGDGIFLFVVKSILMFMCQKRTQAISRLRDLTAAVDGKTKYYCLQVLGNMYLKQGEYNNAIQALKLVKRGVASQQSGPLTTISIIFNWNFNNLMFTAWERLCDAQYASGLVKEIGENLLNMVQTLPEDDKETTHCRILEGIVTRSGEATLLAWTGESSECHSCLPSSPSVYNQTFFVPPSLEGEDLEKRTTELRAIVPRENALLMYDRVTRLQPIRFKRFRLLLPCIVFRVKSIAEERKNVYRAETSELGEVEFTTMDSLPLSKPRRLVLVNPWVHRLREARAGVSREDEDDRESDVESNDDSDTDIDADLVYAPIIEEVSVPSASDTDMYTRALQLIARLGQCFSALLLLKEPDGTYRRVATDSEIIVGISGNKVPGDIRVEVLEVL